MGQAPALLVGETLDVEAKEVDIIGAGGEPGQQLRALADVQAALHAGMAGAEAGQQPGSNRPGFGLGGEREALLLGPPPGGELLFGALEALQQLETGFAQFLAGAGEMQAPAALLEQRDLEGLGK